MSEALGRAWLHRSVLAGSHPDRYDSLMTSPPTPSDRPARPAKLSLARLSTAFSQLMGGKKNSAGTSQAITPLQIVEALLFVGLPDGGVLSAEQLAGPIRDTGPEEIAGLIEKLNRLYDEQEAAYEIVDRGSGYQMQLRGEHAVIANRVAGLEGQQKLSAAALEVLSIVAYRPGISADGVNQLRGRRSNAILARLVRWQLLSAGESAEGAGATCYRTTDRFHQAAGIGSAGDLPRIESLEDAAAAAP